MQHDSTGITLADRRPQRRSEPRRMQVKRIGVAAVAAAFVGGLVVPTGLQAASAQPQQPDATILQLLEQTQQSVVVGQSPLVDEIATNGLSATTPEQLAEARQAVQDAQDARDAEAAAAAEARDAEASDDASATTAAAAPAQAAASVAPSAASGGIVGIAQSQLGVPYVWGGASPATGFDCSGFTQWVYAQVGVSLPHSDRGQHGAGTSVPVSDVQPGDLIVWSGHTAIYVGGDQIIHAATAGSPVKYSSFSAMVGAMGTPYVGRF